MAERHVIILGAGFSGLSLAWKLCSLGIKVSVIESDTTVGGLAGTLRQNGYCMDIGPHSFFTEDKEIHHNVLGLFNNRLAPKPRDVKFYYQGKCLDYTLTAYNVLIQMGIWSGIQSGLSFLKSNIFPRRQPGGGRDETVEGWAISSFGEHLYNTFLNLILNNSGNCHVQSYPPDQFPRTPA